MAHCTVCGVELTQENWYPSSREHHHYICQTCQKKRSRKNHRLSRHHDKILVVEHYSNGTMACANPFGLHKEPFTDMECLSIDHINGGGLKHFKSEGITSGSPFYRWLIEHNYPKGYQVLCMNCQWKKRAKRGEIRKSL